MAGRLRCWLSPRSLEPFIAVQHVLQKQSFLSIPHLLCATHIVPQYLGGGVMKKGIAHLPWDGPALSVTSCPLFCVHPNRTFSLVLNELPLGSSATPLRPFVSQYAAYGMAGKVTALWGVDPITLPCQRSSDVYLPCFLNWIYLCRFAFCTEYLGSLGSWQV